MVGVSTYWITFGALIGNIIDNFTVSLSGRKSYIIPLGVILIMPGIIAIGLLFIPESPRWLLQTNKPKKAQAALKRLRPHQEAIDEELAYMAVGINTEAEFSRNARFVDLWRDPIERRRALLAIGALCIQPASGATYIINSATLQLIVLVYSTYFFEMAGIGTPFGDTCIMAGIGSFVLILNSMIIRKYGRRRMFLGWGMTFCGLSQLIMAAVYTAHPNTNLTGKIIVGCTIIYLTFYNGTISTYSYLCCGEFPSQHFRTYTFGIAASISYVLGWLITFTAPYFINPGSLNWGPKYGYIWAGSCFIGALWVWLYLPEVKNRTFEEIDEMFKAGLPARRFRKYECLISATSTAMTNESKDVDVTTKEVDPSLTTKRTTSL
ncbi:general alpha-glucoside permease protein [Rutstroemia sp. NJR-2017a WRK4]|nr:general alpha-glucoside permease protein [Rutstroemia sp. NJR-2017a WRK4]